MDISDKYQDWIWIAGLDLDDSLLISDGICFLSTSGLLQWSLESLLQTLIPLLFQNFWIWVRKFFKYENPTLVQTPATIIDPIVIYPWFYLRNDHTDSFYCRNRKLTPDPDPFFHKFLTSWPDLGLKGKRRILPESTPTPVSSEISYLCEISDLLLFFRYFTSQNK